MATEIIKRIGSNGAKDSEGNRIRDYATPQLFLDGIANKNLVSQDIVYIGEMYNDDTDYNNGFTIEGFTTDPTRYIEIRNAENNKPCIDRNTLSSLSVVEIKSNYCIVNGIEIKNATANVNSILTVCKSDTHINTTFKNMNIHNCYASANGNIIAISSTKNGGRVLNNKIYDFAPDGDQDLYVITNSDQSSSIIANNVIKNCHNTSGKLLVGLKCQKNDHYVFNNIVTECDVCFGILEGGVLKNNISSDSTAGNGSYSLTNKKFEDLLNEDFTLKENSLARNQGILISDYMIEDYLGRPRQGDNNITIGRQNNNKGSLCCDAGVYEYYTITESELGSGEQFSTLGDWIVSRGGDLIKGDSSDVSKPRNRYEIISQVENVAPTDHQLMNNNTLSFTGKHNTFEFKNGNLGCGTQVSTTNIKQHALDIKNVNSCVIRDITINGTYSGYVDPELILQFQLVGILTDTISSAIIINANIINIHHPASFSPTALIAGIYAPNSTVINAKVVDTGETDETDSSYGGIGITAKTVIGCSVINMYGSSSIGIQCENVYNSISLYSEGSTFAYTGQAYNCICDDTDLEESILNISSTKLIEYNNEDSYPIVGSIFNLQATAKAIDKGCYVKDYNFDITNRSRYDMTIEEFPHHDIGAENYFCNDTGHIDIKTIGLAGSDADFKSTEQDDGFDLWYAWIKSELIVQGDPVSYPMNKVYRCEFLSGAYDYSLRFANSDTLQGFTKTTRLEIATKKDNLVYLFPNWGGVTDDAYFAFSSGFVYGGFSGEPYKYTIIEGFHCNSGESPTDLLSMVYVYGSHYKIRNNTFFDSTTARPLIGVHSHRGNYNMLIYNNIFYNNSGATCITSYDPNYRSNLGNKIFNNSIFHSKNGIGVVGSRSNSAKSSKDIIQGNIVYADNKSYIWVITDAWDSVNYELCKYNVSTTTHKPPLAPGYVDDNIVEEKPLSIWVSPHNNDYHLRKTSILLNKQPRLKIKYKTTDFDGSQPASDVDIYLPPYNSYYFDNYNDYTKRLTSLFDCGAMPYGENIWGCALIPIKLLKNNHGDI